MDTLNRSFQCEVVSVLEERMWLDRREAGRPRSAPVAARFGAIRQWLRDLRARMQLGPVDDDNWTGGDPEKRF